MKTKKSIWTILAGMFMFVLLSSNSGCDSATDKDEQITNDQLNIYLNGQPTPIYDYSPERDVVIQLYNYRMKTVRTWCVWRSDQGMIEGWAACMGYPIPYDVQLTNPVKQEGSTGAVIEQIEPNGLYSSKNTSATWVFPITEIPGKGIEITPIYVEGKVTCYPYPIDVDMDKNRVTRAKVGNATVRILLTEGRELKPPTKKEEKK
jgi:hypothetical protein